MEYFKNHKLDLPALYYGVTLLTPFLFFYILDKVNERSNSFLHTIKHHLRMVVTLNGRCLKCGYSPKSNSEETPVEAKYRRELAKTLYGQY